MQIHTDPLSLKLVRPFVSIGIFDGVHRGHQNLLARLKSLARESCAQTLVITFWPHPRFVLGKADRDLRLLSSLQEKSAMLAAQGIDHLLIVPFTREFAAQSAQVFLDDFLNLHVQPGCIVVGDDLRFGSGGEGNLDLLTQSGARNGYRVIRMDTHSESDVRISSSRIRSCLDSGQLEAANNLLGYPYFLTGRVVEGRKVGNTIGFPTANLESIDNFKQIPSDGVYAVVSDWKGSLRKGMLNIGIRPTIDDGTHKTVEVHLFDVDADLYQELLTVRFIARIRNEMKFSGLDALKQQLAADRKAALKILEEYNINDIII